VSSLLVSARLFVAAELFPVAAKAEDVVPPRITLFAFDTRVQKHPAVLAFEACEVKVPAQCPQPGHRLLPRLGGDGLLAVGALEGLLEVVVFLAVDVHLVVGDERLVGHLFSALDTSETGGVKAATSDPNDLAS